MARKEKYSTHVKPYLKDIIEWIEKGEPEYCIAEKLGISQDSFDRYKSKAEFADTLKKGQQNLTLHIESMLYKKCSGYEYEETKTLIEKGLDGKEKRKVEKIKKQIVPSDVAIIFALKNLNAEKWKDRQEGKFDINQKIQNLVIDIDDDDED
jgi:hypothetical protein